MDPLRWAKIEALYNAALEKQPSERAKYLAQACEDSDLRREVETLLGYADAEFKSPTTEAFLADLREKNPHLHDQVELLLRARGARPARLGAEVLPSLPADLKIGIDSFILCD